ncbi:MAG: sigma-70 family RNA polymerase sigma factor [Nocardioides sp.]
MDVEARRGPDDFEEFVVCAGPRLFSTALLLTGDRPRAEDLTQTAFARVFSRWRLAASADEPLAYARTILLRCFLSERRRRRVAEVSGSTLPEPSQHRQVTRAAPLPVDEVVALRRTLLDALAALSTDDRAVLVLRFWEDLGVGETASLLNITEGACRTRTRRALRRLRTQFPTLEDFDEYH